MISCSNIVENSIRILRDLCKTLHSYRSSGDTRTCDIGTQSYVSHSDGLSVWRCVMLVSQKNRSFEATLNSVSTWPIEVRRTVGCLNAAQKPLANDPCKLLDTAVYVVNWLIYFIYLFILPRPRCQIVPLGFTQQIVNHFTIYTIILVHLLEDQPRVLIGSWLRINGRLSSSLHGSIMLSALTQLIELF